MPFLGWSLAHIGLPVGCEYVLIFLKKPLIKNCLLFKMASTSTIRLHCGFLTEDTVSGHAEWIPFKRIVTVLCQTLKCLKTRPLNACSMKLKAEIPMAICWKCCCRDSQSILQGKMLDGEQGIPCSLWAHSPCESFVCIVLDDSMLIPLLEL